MDEPTLYERLGGIFNIAAVVNDFSDRGVEPEDRQRETRAARVAHGIRTRMPGLKFGRTCGWP